MRIHVLTPLVRVRRRRAQPPPMPELGCSDAKHAPNQLCPRPPLTIRGDVPSHVGGEEAGRRMCYTAPTPYARTLETRLIFDYVQSLSLASLLVLLFLVLVLASEVGHRLGGRFGRPRHRDKDAATLATAAFGLLALLIAFTYSMALMRYDMRRTVVLEQANALRDAARIAPLLPNDAGVPMVNDLRRDADLAIGLGVPYDPKRFDADVADMADVSNRLWGHLDAATADAPTSLPVYRMMTALQALDDATERRVTALRNHVPMTVYWILVGTALVAMAFAGHGAGSAETSRRVSAAIMAALLACVIIVTLDLQRPDRGTVEIPVTPLLDAQHALVPR